MASSSTFVSEITPLIDEDYCIICLQDIVDRTKLPECGHNHTCFQCICAWITSGSETLKVRRCPLCNTPIGTYIIHNVRGEHDFQRYWLPPPAFDSNVAGSVPSPRFLPRAVNTNLSRNRHRRNIRWRKRLVSTSDKLDELERAIEKRRHIYRRDVYAKHVASNRHTRYRPYPTPVQIATSQELCSRILKFVRRELRVWEGLDIEFLTQYIISLLRTMDLRSERVITLLSEFLDSDSVCIPNPLAARRRRGSNAVCEEGTPFKRVERHKHAEHFVHELCTYLRSPFDDLAMWDSTIQYDHTTD